MDLLRLWLLSVSLSVCLLVCCLSPPVDELNICIWSITRLTHHSEYKGRAGWWRRARLLSLSDHFFHFYTLTSMLEVCECDPVLALNFSLISCFLTYLEVFCWVTVEQSKITGFRIMRMQPVDLIFVDPLLSPTVAVPEQRDKLSPCLSDTTRWPKIHENVFPN